MYTYLYFFLLIFVSATLRGQNAIDSVVFETSPNSKLVLRCMEDPECRYFWFPKDVHELQGLYSINHPNDSAFIFISNLELDSLIEISWEVKGFSLYNIDVGQGKKTKPGISVLSIGILGYLEMNKCRFYSEFVFRSGSAKGYFDINNCDFKAAAKFKNVHCGNRFELIKNSFNDTLLFKNCKIHSLNLDCRILPKYLEVTNCEFDSICFLTGDSVNGGGYCKLFANQTILNDFNINYKNFELYFPSEKSAEAQYEFYERLLKKFKEKDQYEDYQKLDIEYKRVKYANSGWSGNVLSVIDDMWWHYGYEKFRIIFWALGFFMLFFVVNVFLLNYLVHEVYSISDLKLHVKRYSSQKGLKRYNKNIGYAAIYTAYVFLGIKLDVHELRHKKLIPVLYIFLCYVSGLICLAYIVRFVFSF